MPVIKAEFDGKVFVPVEPVDLRKGALVEIVVSESPRKPTPEDDHLWQEMLQQVRATEPPFATVDDEMRYLRKRR